MAFLHGICEPVLGEGQEDLVPLAAVSIGEQRRAARETPPVADRRGLEHVSIVIYFECQAVADARIGTSHAIDFVQLSLVVKRHRFPRMREKHRVQIVLLRLQRHDRQIVFRNRVRTPRLLLAIKRKNFLSQHRPLECAAGLARFFGRKVRGKNRVVEQHRRVRIAALARVARYRLPIIFVRQMPRYSAAAQENSGVKPHFGQHRRHTRRSIHVAARRKRARLAQGLEFLGVELIDPAKATELPLDPIEESMVIRVRTDEAVVADVVVCLNALHHMHREGQARNPRRPRRLVRQVKLRRRPRNRLASPLPDCFRS